jgi:hypothetical protein
MFYLCFFLCILLLFFFWKKKYYISYKHFNEPNEVLKQCSELFSFHYGIWKNGQRVKMNSSFLQKNYFYDNCHLITAFQSNLIGHCFYRRFYYPPGDGYVLWITQLVVHKNYRNKGIATRLCKEMLKRHTNIFAYGVVTSHPYCVRALLDKKKINKKLILQHSQQLIHFSNINYIQNKKIHDIRINTEFYIDHTEINTLLQRKENQFLGFLDDGEEFFIFVFL